MEPVPVRVQRYATILTTSELNSGQYRLKSGLQRLNELFSSTSRPKEWIIM
jgi:hypothetical protein